MTRWQSRDYVIKTFREELRRDIHADRYTRAVPGFKYLIIECKLFDQRGIISWHVTTA